MIHCIIIDDEPLALEHLSIQIKKIPDLKLIGTFDSALDALPLINNGDIDLIFCDIQMPDINGVSFLKSLKNPPLFIFVTGDPDHAIESFELDVVDYILKPFELDRLLKSVNKVRAFIKSLHTNPTQQDFLVIKDRSLHIITPYNEIHYIKSDRDYVQVFTFEKVYIMYKKISEVEEILSAAKQFIRVQKSYIVNLDYVKTIDANSIKMKGNIKDIPVGLQYKPILYNRMGINI